MLGGDNCVSCVCCSSPPPGARSRIHFADRMSSREYVCAHSRRPFVRVDFSFLKSSRRQAPLAANTARHRQHGAPTRRGGAVDWLHPCWCRAPLKLKKPLYDRVRWVETSTACTWSSTSMWHGTLMEVVEQAYVSACRCVIPLRRSYAPSQRCRGWPPTRACVHMPQRLFVHVMPAHAMLTRDAGCYSR